MRTRELVAALRRAAPPGLSMLDSVTLDRLRLITAELLAASPPEIASSAERFQQLSGRELAFDQNSLRAGIEGRVVLVTGGTGCIGSSLLGLLREFGARQLVSVSKGSIAWGKVVETVDYVHADIRDEALLRRIFAHVEPDIVFHLAAQRDPGLAERTVSESLDVNIFGTQNVLAASLAARVDSFVYASTGKALRPFTPHVYAASKKIGEFLAFAAAQNSDMRVRIARFTHVADNSLVLDRFRSVREGDALRVHDPKIQFYTQSAREAAQLLLLANGTRAARGDVDVMAIHNLGLPTDLLNLALAIASESSQLRPIYIAGSEPGYEDSYYPGLYDPETAADVTPLLNAFEAARASNIDGVGIDASPVCISDHSQTLEVLIGLDDALRRRAPDAYLRESLNAISMCVFEATLDCVPSAVLQRLVRLTWPQRGDERD